eukprot:6182456-Pleurochrysis_carterae.AAC.1
MAVPARPQRRGRVLCTQRGRRTVGQWRKMQAGSRLVLCRCKVLDVRRHDALEGGLADARERARAEEEVEAKRRAAEPEGDAAHHKRADPHHQPSSEQAEL